jgi:hypothetical protein
MLPDGGVVIRQHDLSLSEKIPASIGHQYSQTKEIQNHTHEKNNDYNTSHHTTNLF